MRLPFREPVLPVLALSCGVAILVFSAGSPVRLIAGILLVLVLPGATLGRAVLPRGEQGPEHVLVALGASAIVVALGAIGLDVVGIPLQPTVWAPVLVILTLVGSAVGSFRDFGPKPGGLRLPPLRRTDTLLIAAALALTAAAVTLGTTPLRAPPGTPTSTALWIEADGARRATAVVSSGKLQTARYKLYVTVDGRTVGASPSFSLDPGDQYRVPVPPPLRAGARVEALLYSLDHRARRFPRRADLTFGGTVPLASAATRP